MDILARVLPDGPNPAAICGRECQDGSACQNIVDRPGDACWIDSHGDDDPRVDGGPMDPSEVPGPDLGRRGFEYIAGVGSALGLGLAWWLGWGRFGMTILSGGFAIGLTVVVALAVGVYQRRALTEGDCTGEG